MSDLLERVFRHMKRDGVTMEHDDCAVWCEWYPPSHPRVAYSLVVSRGDESPPRPWYAPFKKRRANDRYIEVITEALDPVESPHIFKTTAIGGKQGYSTVTLRCTREVARISHDSMVSVLIEDERDAMALREELSDLPTVPSKRRRWGRNGAVGTPDRAAPETTQGSSEG